MREHMPVNAGMLLRELHRRRDLLPTRHRVDPRSIAGCYIMYHIKLHISAETCALYRRPRQPLPPQAHSPRHHITHPSAHRISLPGTAACLHQNLNAARIPAPGFMEVAAVTFVMCFGSVFLSVQVICTFNFCMNMTVEGYFFKFYSKLDFNFSRKMFTPRLAIRHFIHSNLLFPKTKLSNFTSDVRKI